MNKVELLVWYSSMESEKMPTYTEATDANNSQLFIDGEWKNTVYSWTLLCVDGIWKYAETDSERGYVLDFKIFNSEEDAVEYAKSILQKKYSAIGRNSTKEMLSRYVQQKFGYSEKRAKIMVDQMAIHQDVFEEFFNYARIGKFCKKDKTQTQLYGYTAEILNKEFNLSPLGAYNYLVYLIEDPEHALADLKAGLPRK